MMTYDEVMKYVQEHSSLSPSEFYSSPNEYIRVFAHAKKVGNECVIDRTCGTDTVSDPNGDKVKQHIKDKLGFICETTKKVNKVIFEYKITGIEERFSAGTVKAPSSAVKKAVGQDNCEWMDTSSNLEIDHRYLYRLYDDDEFNENPKNYRRLHRVAQSVDRERRRKMRESGEKYDNRKMGCFFHTVLGTNKYDEAEATKDQPSYGVYWENPKVINQRDKALFLEYQKKLPDLSAIQMCKAINDITFLARNVPGGTIRIENVDDVVRRIKGV